jgi:hypothetical protein
MKTIDKAYLTKRVLAYELVAFITIIVIVWLDEIIDMPSLLGAQATPVNWREAIFETLLIAPLGLLIMRNTKVLIERMKYLEGFLRICSSCKRIRDDQGKWQEMEAYIHDRSEARFSHGICPHCAAKLYPEFYTENNDPAAMTQLLVKRI